MEVNRLLKHCLLCLGASMLAACASPPIVRSIVAANQAQEEAVNKLVLLNIARAHERMPMHFSLIGQIRSGPGGWGLGVPSLALEIPFGGAAERKYGLSVASDGQTPADVTPLTNQEFMRGITKMLDPELMAYFATQGWPSAMLMHLFVESIDVINKEGKVTERLVNDPLHPNFSRFQAFVNEASRCHLIPDQTNSESYFSTRVETVTPREGTEAKNANLTVLEVDSGGNATKDSNAKAGCRLASVSTSSVIRFVAHPGEGGGNNNECEKGPSIDKDGKFIFNAPEPQKSVSTTGQSGETRVVTMKNVGKLLDQARRHGMTESEKAGKQQHEVQFVTRSAQGIIYYLGELSRVQNSSWSTKTFDRPLRIALPDGSPAILFQMLNSEPDVAPAVSVEYGGQTFWVPKFKGGAPGQTQDRSVMTLSLLMLVLGLQDKGTDAPSVNNVRVLR